MAAKSQEGVGDPSFLKALEIITRDITKLDNIAEVVSLTNLRIFQNKGKLFGNYPVVVPPVKTFPSLTPSNWRR